MKRLIIDARGRSCPEPVLMTMQAMAKNEKTFQVFVDNKVAVENITRCCNNKGFNLTVIEDGADYKLNINRK